MAKHSALPLVFLKINARFQLVDVYFQKHFVEQPVKPPEFLK